MATVCELSRFVPVAKVQVSRCPVYAYPHKVDTKRTFEDDAE